MSILESEGVMKILDNLTGRNQVQDFKGYEIPGSVPGNFALGAAMGGDQAKPSLYDRIFSAQGAKEILAGASAGISAFSKLSAARSKAAGLSAEAGENIFAAQQLDLLAEQEKIFGVQQVALLQEEFGAREANDQVALNASGISGGATVDATFEQHRKSKVSAIEASELDTRSRVASTKQSALSRRRVARALRASAKDTKRAGKFGAFGDFIDLASQHVMRG
jgi:hypothetical protein